jgi:hypothetical protein
MKKRIDPRLERLFIIWKAALLVPMLIVVALQYTDVLKEPWATRAFVVTCVFVSVLSAFSMRFLKKSR